MWGKKRGYERGEQCVTVKNARAKGLELGGEGSAYQTESKRQGREARTSY